MIAKESQRKRCEENDELTLNNSKTAQLLITHKANAQRNDQNRPKNY